MNLSEEFKKIKNNIEKMTMEEFEEMLIRNGIKELSGNDCSYVKCVKKEYLTEQMMYSNKAKYEYDRYNTFEAHGGAA